MPGYWARGWKRCRFVFRRNRLRHGHWPNGWKVIRRLNGFTTRGCHIHPQHALAMEQQRAGGAIVSFEVKGGKDAAWRVVNSCQLLSITANLGDTRTTITHPATTTHGRISPEARAAAGIHDNLLRVAVGLESVD